MAQMAGNCNLQMIHLSNKKKIPPGLILDTFITKI